MGASNAGSLDAPPLFSMRVMMPVYRYAPGFLALALAACSAQPSAKTKSDIVVVQGSARAPINSVFAKQPDAAVTPTPAAAAPRLLSVAESAKIHTSEMWSEPIAAN